jgi:hypothetical protein
MNARTPGPWKTSTLDNTDIAIHGKSQKGKHGGTVSDLIATVSCGLNSIQAANAAFIVQTCNAHDELVAALEFLQESIGIGLAKGWTVHDLLHAVWDGNMQTVMGTIYSALRKAKGETQ